MRNIKIFDTTLRDGEQSPGCTMSMEDKIKIAKKLNDMNYYLYTYQGLHRVKDKIIFDLYTLQKTRISRLASLPCGSTRKRQSHLLNAGHPQASHP